MYICMYVWWGEGAGGGEVEREREVERKREGRQAGGEEGRERERGEHCYLYFYTLNNMLNASFLYSFSFQEHLISLHERD